MKLVSSRLGMRRYLVCTALLCFGAMHGLLPTGALAQGKEEDRVRHTMMATFHKPTDPLKVDPVVIRGDHAVAGWIQGDRGGRAVLLREKGNWIITVCGGDGLKQAEALAQTGMPLARAKELAQALALAESRLNSQTVGMFARFEGIVKVQAGHGGHHGAKAAASH